MEDDSVSDAIDGTSYADVKVGALMMFTDDGNGTAVAYAVLANAAFDAADEANSAAKPFTVNATLEGVIASDADLDTEIVYGQIESTKKVSKGTNITPVVGDGLTVLGSTNAYTIKDDSTADKARIYVGAWDAFDVGTAEDYDYEKANWFIAKIVDGKVADFITFARPFAY